MIRGVGSSPPSHLDLAETEPPIEELYRDVYTDCWGPFTGTTPPAMLDDEPEEPA